MTSIETKFFNWAQKKMEDFWDEDPLQACVDLMCKEHGLDEEISEWLVKQFWTQDALAAGIPLSVIEGKTALRDHFTQDYIDSQTGRKK